MPEKIEVELIGTDGNAFAVIGKVSKAMKRAGMNSEAEAFRQLARTCNSYEELLALVDETVEVV